MALSRGELKGQILRLFYNTGAYTGAFSDDMLNDAIQEAMDEVAVHMFIAGEGWTDKIAYYDTTAGQVTLALRESMAMIREVRYLYGDVYIPMTYDTENGRPQYSDASGVRQYSYTYRILDNQLFFNPAMAEGGTKYLQIEYTDFPKFLTGDDDEIPAQFNRAFTNYIKYSAASVLASSIEKFVVPWKEKERNWFTLMKEVVVKRNLQATQVREFGDY